MYKQVTEAIRQAYDKKVDERDQKELSAWKRTEQGYFLERMRREEKSKLLEIGAGTGVHGKFFQDKGLKVVCTDLSPEMVKRCREKGLEAYVMDFLSLDFPPGSFEAVFAMNCLLHVPRSDLPDVLAIIQELLGDNGLFYWGQYGGPEHAGVSEEDHYEPKRFYSLLTDDQIKTISRQYFEVISFKAIDIEDDEMHFQALVLRQNSSGGNR